MKYGENMKCIHCEVEIESDDNFCWNCGHWTARGYKFLKDQENIKMIMSGDAIKQNNRFSTLFILTMISFILFTTLVIIRGNDLFKPVIFLKKQVINYVYGYNTSIIKTDNIYNDKIIMTQDDAYQIIIKDFDEQDWQCSSNLEIDFLERDIEDKNNIPSVSFCDMSYEQAQEISSVINEMYNLFPNIKGALTNITITNANTNSEYIAYFQPMYQFVNTNEDIKSFNKVNKTQILLNSYYFLNEEITSNSVESVVENGWYVKDATWESTIAHELGHYISFVTLLNEYDLKNITLETSANTDIIGKVLKEFDSGTHSKEILDEALQNYNTQYGEELDLNTFALTISKYAGAKDKNGNLIAEETIAEAIHDYYLHNNNCSKSSLEIVKIIKSRL